MQIGFSKNISENLIDDFLSTITKNLKDEKKLKLSKFGTFSIRQKKAELVETLKLKNKKLYQIETLFYLKLLKILKI